MIALKPKLVPQQPLSMNLARLNPGDRCPTQFIVTIVPTEADVEDLIRSGRAIQPHGLHYAGVPMKIPGVDVKELAKKTHDSISAALDQGTLHTAGARTAMENVPLGPLNASLRDGLSCAGINPVCSMAGMGVVIWGTSTVSGYDLRALRMMARHLRVVSAAIHEAWKKINASAHKSDGPTDLDLRINMEAVSEHVWSAHMDTVKVAPEPTASDIRVYAAPMPGPTMRRDEFAIALDFPGVAIGPTNPADRHVFHIRSHGPNAGIEVSGPELLMREIKAIWPSLFEGSAIAAQQQPSAMDDYVRASSETFEAARRAMLNGETVRRAAWPIQTAIYTKIVDGQPVMQYVSNLMGFDNEEPVTLSSADIFTQDWMMLGVRNHG